ncbi:MAG: NAD-binding protein [Pseudomonadota bacterium]
MNAGFVGLGIMGRPQALNVMKAGHAMAVWEALTKGFAGSRMLEVFGPRMMQRQFVAGLDARLHHKDANIVLQCAYESKTPAPGAALAAQAFNALMARAGTRWDSAAILQVIEDMNGRKG